MAAALPYLALAVSAGSAIEQHQQSHQAREDTLKATAEAKSRQAASDKLLADQAAQATQIENRDAMRLKQRQNAVAAGGVKQSTILTSPLGTTSNTPGTYGGGQKTLLGA